MGKKFTTYVAVHKDPAESVWFSPGDDVPDWAVDLVGDHVYTDSEPERDVRFEDPHYEPDQPEVGFSTVTTLPEVVGGVSADETEAELESYDDFTKDELKDLCEQRGLPVSGNKAELISRLEEDDESGDAEE